MFEQALAPGTKDNLALLGRSGILADAYLADGTAAGLHLGHRVSVDLGFFTSTEFIPKAFSAELSALGLFEEEQANKGSVLGNFRGIRFSLFVYRYPLISTPEEYLALRLAGIPDIAAMKVDAIATRGVKRDFVDLYFICLAGYSLPEVLGFYDKKYGTLACFREKKNYIFGCDRPSTKYHLLLGQHRWDAQASCSVCLWPT